MIKAVIFDIDGVLIDSFEANQHHIELLFTKAGYEPPPSKDYAAGFHLSMYDIIKQFTKASDEEVKRIWEMGRSGEVPYPSEMIKVSKEVDETLNILSKKYLLGIVTSRVKEGFYNIPVLFAINKYFKTVVSFQDTKNHKPHPEPLLLALKRLKTKAQESVYIGDQLADIQAAKAAGMEIILYAKEKIGEPDLFTSDFEELPKLIKTI